MTTTETSTQPVVIRREDYRPPDHRVEAVELTFELGEQETLVHARMEVERTSAAPADAPLVLDGEQLETLALRVDGRELVPEKYREEPQRLVIEGLPERFVLESSVRIHPERNTALSGLYRSNGGFYTQCEAMGFRRITWFLDRPDVMARYRTRIVADPGRWPVLLSNGNRVAVGEEADGRAWVQWEDPFPKPSYLFALVAADLACYPGTFVTRSGRELRLEIWVEPRDLDRCEHALRSLRHAMAWDEERFGLEYDLDVYMIVAVGDFNMGAMENKGLNLFNSKFVLARPDTATDDDYEHIEGVIAHEYFHNWTGNRVTCRDWFQLTLKEGLTVLRDQLFSADRGSPAVRRIATVRQLRVVQFAEDAGPMAHPIRPESYISMDNFYTATVYEKGAEVVRMYRTLLGAEGFRRGMDLYFERHDGQAVTCDDFRAAMADANGADLAQFELWYSQAGTPVLEARGEHDPAARRYVLELAQSRPDLPGHPPYRPMHVPVAVGLLGPDGADLALRLVGEERAAAPGTRLLELRAARERFVFEGVAEPPVPSILRGFSAPVRLEIARSRAERAFLMAHDSDPFQRWDAGQELAQELLLERVAAQDEPPPLDALFVEAFGRVLADEGLDGSFKALALVLPAERQLAMRMEVVDVDGIHRARTTAMGELARVHREALEATVEACCDAGPHESDAEAVDRRRLGNVALAYLAVLREPRTSELVARHFEEAADMTDSQAALGLLVDLGGVERERALAAFYARWKDDALVLDKWFALQALSSAPDTTERVRALAEHPDFHLRNPNRARALLGSFAAGNQLRFHDAHGAGYRLVADKVLELDALNPLVAARLAGAFNHWRRFDAERRAAMRAELERIAGKADLSKDVYEIVERALRG